MNIPKIFWKYYDLFRRKLLTIEDFSQKTGLEQNTIRLYLQEISKNSK